MNSRGTSKEPSKSLYVSPNVFVNSKSKKCLPYGTFFIVVLSTRINIPPVYPAEPEIEVLKLIPPTPAIPPVPDGSKYPVTPPPVTPDVVKYKRTLSYLYERRTCMAPVNPVKLIPVPP